MYLHLLKIYADSPRRTKKFNALSVFDTDSSSFLNVSNDSRSGRVSPLIMSPPRLDDDDDNHSPPYDKLGESSGILIDDCKYL